MQQDIITTMRVITPDIFNNRLLFTDIRKQAKGNKVFGKRVELANLLGYSFSNDTGYGLFMQEQYPVSKMVI